VDQLSIEKTEHLLKLVSRSFSLCIPLLPEIVKTQVKNFYLLCRYADSIEDSTLTIKEKKYYFKNFINIIKTQNKKKLVNLNNKLLPHIICKSDKIMIKNFVFVLEEFSSLDKKSQKISMKWLTKMIKGMEKYSKKEIQDFKDLNNYCYFVAGTVGLYLTDIFEYKFNLKKNKALVKKAKDFGLLLQKVNIIRDFSKDYKEGRVFWPKKLFEKNKITKHCVFNESNSITRKKILKEMILSARKNVLSSFEYIQMLPANETSLRTFCAIPLFMAIPTLAKCANNDDIFNFDEKVKIDKKETLKIIYSIKKNIGNNEFIKNYYKKKFLLSDTLKS
jgi:farnesyl-diphosphate farnesyltransferase